MDAQQRSSGPLDPWLKRLKQCVLNCISYNPDHSSLFKSHNSFVKLRIEIQRTQNRMKDGIITEDKAQKIAEKLNHFSWIRDVTRQNSKLSSRLNPLVIDDSPVEIRDTRTKLEKNIQNAIIRTINEVKLGLSEEKNKSWFKEKSESAQNDVSKAIKALDKFHHILLYYGDGKCIDYCNLLNTNQGGQNNQAIDQWWDTLFTSQPGRAPEQLRNKFGVLRNDLGTLLQNFESSPSSGCIDRYSEYRRAVLAQCREYDNKFKMSDSNFSPLNLMFQELLEPFHPDSMQIPEIYNFSNNSRKAYLKAKAEEVYKKAEAIANEVHRDYHEVFRETYRKFINDYTHFYHKYLEEKDHYDNKDKLWLNSYKDLHDLLSSFCKSLTKVQSHLAFHRSRWEYYLESRNFPAGSQEHQNATALADRITILQEVKEILPTADERNQWLDAIFALKPSGTEMGFAHIPKEQLAAVQANYDQLIGLLPEKLANLAGFTQILQNTGIFPS